MTALLKPKPTPAKQYTVLTPEQRLLYARSHEQTKAIWALDGFYPTPEDDAMVAAIVAGRVGPEQVREEYLEYLLVHKHTRGFIESRTWAMR